MAKQGEIIKNYDKSPEMGEVDYVVEWQKPTEKNGYTWYRLYASGWITIGGSGGGTGTSYRITLPKDIGNTNYHIQVTRKGASEAAPYAYINDTSHFTIEYKNYGSSSGNVCWYLVNGFIS